MAARILVPVDHSTQAWAALEYAFETHPEASFVVLHVVQPLETVLEGDVYGSERNIARAEEEAGDIMDEVEALAEVYEVPVETRIQHGRPAKRIVETADESDVDHIILGSHGRSGMTRILLGSVAEHVVRRAAVPVTVVR